MTLQNVLTTELWETRGEQGHILGSYMCDKCPAILQAQHVKTLLTMFTIDCFMFDRKVIIPTVEGLHYYRPKKTLKTIVGFSIVLPVNIQI